MYEKLTSSFGQNDHSNGFERDRGRRREKFSNKGNHVLPINAKRTMHLGLQVNDVYAFAENEEKATYEPG